MCHSNGKQEIAFVISLPMASMGGFIVMPGLLLVHYTTTSSLEWAGKAKDAK